jgi:hypothetical protein
VVVFHPIARPVKLESVPKIGGMTPVHIAQTVPVTRLLLLMHVRH